MYYLMYKNNIFNPIFWQTDESWNLSGVDVFRVTKLLYYLSQNIQPRSPWALIIAISFPANFFFVNFCYD